MAIASGAVGPDMPTPVPANERVDLLDAIRGVALGGILLANLMSFFGADMLGAEGRRAMPFGMAWHRVITGKKPVAPTKPEPAPPAPVVLTQAEKARAASLEKDRRQLFDEVWSLPTQKVAAQHGVSDVAIAKTCKRLKIPKPPRGYWAKKAAGLPVPDQPTLPPLGD